MPTIKTLPREKPAECEHYYDLYDVSRSFDRNPLNNYLDTSVVSLAPVGEDGSYGAIKNEVKLCLANCCIAKQGRPFGIVPGKLIDGLCCAKDFKNMCATYKEVHPDKKGT